MNHYVFMAGQAGNGTAKTFEYASQDLAGKIRDPGPRTVWIYGFASSTLEKRIRDASGAVRTTREAFDPPDFGVPDVYWAVAALPAGSVKGLHAISHAYSACPNLILGTEARDAQPYGGDFSAQGPLLKAALASDASVKVWGCNYQKPFLLRIIRAMRAGRATEIESLKTEFHAQVKATYAFSLATAIGQPVRAAPPGVGTGPIPGGLIWGVPSLHYANFRPYWKFVSDAGYTVDKAGYMPYEP